MGNMAIVYGGHEQSYWETMANKNAAIFLEYAHLSLWQHDDAWIAKAYRMAATQEPELAFRFSTNFAARSWAKNLLLNLAQLEPAAAFTYFPRYAFPYGSPTEPVELNKNKIVTSLHRQKGEDLKGAYDAIDAAPDEHFIGRAKTVLKAQRLREILAQPAHKRADQIIEEHQADTKHNSMRAWAGQVLLKAANANPDWKESFQDQPAQIAALEKAMQAPYFQR